MSTSSYQHFLARLEATPQATIHLGLDVMRSAVQAEGLRRPAPTIVTVAGTNGKGSVAAALSQLCTQRGWTTTLLTSPHLIDVRERIRINGRPIAQDLLMELGDPLLQRYGAESQRTPRPLSYFELTVLLGLRAAQHAQSDVLILEVGLGGQYDATNVLDADLAVFTSISLDHTDLLGNTIEAIAYEKSCIARPDRPALIHPKLQGAAALSDCLKQHGALLIEASGGRLARSRNLALAQSAFSVLEVEAGRVSPPEFVQDVIDDFQWPGRQTWATTPQGTRVLLDGAHNAESAQELARFLDAHPPQQKLPAVLSLSRGRTVEDVVAPLAHHARTWHVCTPQMERAMAGKTLGLALHKWQQESSQESRTPPPQIVWHERVEDALQAAEIEVQSNDLDGLLVFGSLYLVGEAYAHWWPHQDAMLSLSKREARSLWAQTSNTPAHHTASPTARSTTPAFEGGSEASNTPVTQRIGTFLNGPWFPEDPAPKQPQRNIAFPRVVATGAAFSAIILMTISTLMLGQNVPIYTRLSVGTILGNSLPAVALILGFSLTWGIQKPKFRFVLHALWMGVVFSLAGTFLTGFLDEVFRWILSGTFAEAWWTAIMEAREASYDALLTPKGMIATTTAFFTVSVWPGIFEEFLFRGAIYRVLNRVKVWRRVLFIGILFAFIHFDVVGFIPLAILGFLLSWLRALSGSWIYSAIVHIGFNATALALSMWAVGLGLGEGAAMEESSDLGLWAFAVFAPAGLYAAYLFRNFGRNLLNLRKNL